MRMVHRDVPASDMGPQQRPRTSRRGRRGIALVLVISVLLILVVIATGFAAFTSNDMKTSQANYEQAETYFLAESGIDYGKFLIKHNMLVYPDPPSTWADYDLGGHTTAIYDANNDGTNDPPGGLVSLYAANGGQEFVVVDDLDVKHTNLYSGVVTPNWLGATKVAGTFLLKMQVVRPGSTNSSVFGGYSVTNSSSTDYMIIFSSTGYLKQMPGTVDSTSVSGYAGNNAPSVLTGSAAWTILAQRTLFATCIMASSFTSTSTPTKRIQVQEYNEKFR